MRLVAVGGEPQTSHGGQQVNSADPLRNLQILLAETDERVPVLALRPRETARALGISERLLWTLTKSREIECRHLNRTVVYPVELLRRFLVKKAKENSQKQGSVHLGRHTAGGRSGHPRGHEVLLMPFA